MNCAVQNEEMQATPEHETISGDSAITGVTCLSKVERSESCSKLGAHISQEQVSSAPLEIRVIVPSSLQENTSSGLAVTRVIKSVLKVDPSESLGINEAQEQVSSTFDPQILDTFSLQAEPIVNSKATVSSARKSFKRLSAEGFYRCGNRNGSCGYLTLLPTQFGAHMREEHANECAFPCVHCGSVEMTCDSLLQHLEEHLTQQSLLFYCAESSCDFNSSSPDEVLQHIVNSHSTLTSFSCWCCSASFSSIQTFDTHVKQNILQVAKCPHCSAKDTDRQRILTHISSSHTGYARMVRIHKMFLCGNRTMSAWYNSTASYSTRDKPLVKQENDVIDLTGSSDCEDDITIDNREKNPSLGNNTDNCAKYDGLPLQMTAEEMELSDHDRSRVTAGETSQDTVSERQVIDSSCRLSTDVMADITATSVDWNEHEGAREREMDISHSEEEGSDCVLRNAVQKSRADKKRKYKTRNSGSNTKPQRHRGQELSVSSNNSSNWQIPFNSKILKDKCFESVTGGETTYHCRLCNYNFDKGSRKKTAICNRLLKHYNTKHKETQKPSVSSNSSNTRLIPFNSKIITKTWFKLTGYDTTYSCKICHFKIDIGSKEESSIRNRMWRHLKDKHKEKPPAGT